jgi:hypothetical protein
MAKRPRLQRRQHCRPIGMFVVDLDPFHFPIQDDGRARRRRCSTATNRRRLRGVPLNDPRDFARLREAVSIFEFLIFAGCVLAFCTSVGLLVLNQERYEHLCERWPYIQPLPFIGGFMLFILLPSIGGEISRGEVRAWPPDEFVFRERLHGFSDAALLNGVSD